MLLYPSPTEQVVIPHLQSRSFVSEDRETSGKGVLDPTTEWIFTSFLYTAYLLVSIRDLLRRT